MKRIEITRSFHFYAAHRNENLDNKCRNIHGHTYYVDVIILQGQKEFEVTTLFDDIDKLISPIISEFDHSFIINKNDNLYSYLKAFPEPLKFYVLEYESNVENIAMHLARMIYRKTKLNIIKLTLRETKSCTVSVFSEDIQIGKY